MPHYKQVAQEKQAQRDRAIPTEWKLKELPSPDVLNVTDVPRTSRILSDEELHITEDYDATALAQAIASRRLKSIDVTIAYCKRAAIAQQVTNCLTEIFFDQALTRARYLDGYINHHGTTAGPLHGVPISLKDTFRIPRIDSTIGYAALAHKPSNTTSPLVQILLEAGAVLYYKTNVPQTLMALDSDNNVWGRTLNPVNRKVTAGGSSGGEGALIAMKGSPLGVGTDIGGSIRIPAFCNGLYGIKPSADRIPYIGQQESGLPGTSSISLKSRAGPLARSLRDCELFLRTVAASAPWLRDPNIVPGFWDSMDLGPRREQGLRFGVLMTDNTTTPLPPIRNLLHEVTSALNKAGHSATVIPTPPAFAKLQFLSAALLSAVGSEHTFAIMKETGEPLIAWLKERMHERPPRSLYELADLQKQREELATEVLKQLWSVATPDGNVEVDALICLVAPHPVPGIDRWDAVGYTIDWVLLDYCAGFVPVRMFEEKDMEGEPEGKEGEVLGSTDKRNRELWKREERKTYLGTPLGVQVVAPKLQEKRLYRAMETVDGAVKGKKWMANESVIGDTMGGMVGAKL